MAARENEKGEWMDGWSETSEQVVSFDLGSRRSLLLGRHAKEEKCSRVITSRETFVESK